MIFKKITKLAYFSCFRQKQDILYVFDGEMPKEAQKRLLSTIFCFIRPPETIRASDDYYRCDVIMIQTTKEKNS